MGMVFQEPMTALNPVMRCGEQIDELLREHTDWPGARRRQEILQVLERVSLPDPERMMRSYPHQLSGGQRQRIVIAMAVILQPMLLICDEPTTALDVTTQKEILRLIDELHRSRGCAVLFITHDMGVVAEIADQVLVMNQGLAVEYGSSDEVLNHPQAEYTRMLLAAVPGLVPPPARAAPRGAALLRGTGVGKTYLSRDWLGRGRHTAALMDAALAVHAGETVGIVGESGSGKSTLARCLIRLIEPSSGRIDWGDAEVAMLPEARLRPLRNRVQVVFQDPNRSLNPRMTVGNAIIEGAMNFGATHEQALAAGVRQIAKEQAVDIVFTGKQTIDGDTAQVGPGIAKRMGLQLLTYVSRIVETDLEARTITVERPQRDESGKVILATKGKTKGKPVADSSLRDTENVPLHEDVETYFKREVLPHAADAWIDHEKTKVGYEIPFNRHFYVFKPPRPLGEIDAELKGVTDKILTMIQGLSA